MARETKAPMETIFMITRTIFVHVFIFGCNICPNHCHAKSKSRSNWPDTFGLPTYFIYFIILHSIFYPSKADD